VSDAYIAQHNISKIDASNWLAIQKVAKWSSTTEIHLGWIHNHINEEATFGFR
jgi:hypothetical protein